MRSEETLRRWSNLAVAVASVLAALAILHLARQYALLGESRVRWHGQEWLLAGLAVIQLIVVAAVRRFLRRNQVRRIAEEEVAARGRARIERGLASISEGIAVWSAAGDLVFSNPRFAELAGYLPSAPGEGMKIDAFIEQSGEALFPAQAAERARWVAERQAAHAHAGDVPHRFATPDGRCLEIRDRHIGDGEVATVLRDVTVSCEHDRLLSTSVARFRDGIESMADGFLLWDADDRLVAINRRARELLPHLAEMRMLGRTFSDCVLEALARGRPELDADQRAAWLQTRLEKRRRREPHDLYPPNGTVVVAVERPTSDGGLVSLLRDVTVERRARTMIERALANERDTNARQRRFAAIVAHEFRTPLAIIDGAAQRIEARLESEAAAELRPRLVRIREAVTRMTGLIDMTLTSRRQDAAIGTPAPSEFDLCALLREAIASQVARTPHVSIRLDAPAGAVPVTADRTMMGQAIGHLLSNAVKYGSRGERVDVTLTSESRSVAIAVRDFGVGIPEDEIDRLSTGSFRASTAGAVPGTGIGLPLVNELVGLHGGHVEVSSRAGEGSTFTVHLPCRPGVIAQAAD